MKKYKFKLEAILKMRKLKEEQCKAEIGRLQILINNFKEQIDVHNKGIDEAYASQETSLSNGIDGQGLQFFPYFVSGKNAHIGYLNTEISSLEEKVKTKFNELKQLRANLKLIENMKEKDHAKYKKQLTKKQFEAMEENVQNWKISQKKVI